LAASNEVLGFGDLLGLLGEKEEALRPKPLLRGEYRNYTPLMLGDYRARQFRCLDPDCEAIAVSPGLAAQALRGRARWLARVALASLQGCGGNYISIEKGCGAVRLDGIGRLGLVELMFGTLASTQLASPFTLTARLEIDQQKGTDYSSVAEGYADKPRSERPARLNLLYMGKEPKRDGSDPHRLERVLLDAWATGSARLRLEVHVSPRWRMLLEKAAPEDRDRLEAVPCLYAALAAATPLIIGLGKAVTRGFGRLAPEMFTATKLCSDEAWRLYGDVLRSLRSLAGERDPGNAEVHLRRVLEGLLGLAEQATGLARKKPSDWDTVPRLVDAISGLRVIRVGCNEDPIRAIGRAVLKQSWKKSVGADRGSGLAFHTWPLGLPRKSEVKCKCNERGDKTQPKGLYGYIVVDDNLARKYGVSGNDCFLDERCTGRARESRVLEMGDDDVRIETRVAVDDRRESVLVTPKAKDVRHQSMVMLFPLPGGRDLVAVLPLPSYGLNLGLDKEAPKPADTELHLIHLGGHAGRTGKLPPCCNTHVVEVALAFTGQDMVPPPEENVEDCGCGGDPAGIHHPGEQSPKPCSGSGCYREAVETAIKWVVEVLRNCSRERAAHRGPPRPMGRRGGRRMGGTRWG